MARAWRRAGVRLALLDEPFRGLAADQRRALLAAARARFREATLLCVTHSAAEAAGFDRVVVLAGGRVADEGAPGVLAARAGSEFRAMLDAEAAADAALAAPCWRRLHLAAGRLRELTSAAPMRAVRGAARARAGAAAAPPRAVYDSDT